MPEPRYAVGDLDRLARDLLVAAGVDAEDAAITAEGLLAADLRGVTSHGLAHLPRRLERLASGRVAARPDERIGRNTPLSAIIDAGGGLGIPPSRRAMDLAIAKARATGAGLVAVRNSTHNGMASYYALRALPHDLIGLALTNATPMVVPPGGRAAVYGTNPICVAVPALEEPPLVLDMATSAAAWGKVEVAARTSAPIPTGIALDGAGRVTTDAALALTARALLPLGGAAETGAYKGFGLAVLVDVFTAVLSGGAPGQSIVEGGSSHLLGALRIDLFREPHDFRRAIDSLIRELRATPVPPGAPPVSLPGERETRLEAEHRARGVPLDAATLEELRAAAARLGVAYALEPAGV
jgi:LDH2 family malate/lactate/ureidoglycolate dehydrogenase